MTETDWDRWNKEWNTAKALDHMPFPPMYLIPAEMKSYQEHMESCNFCVWIARIRFAEEDPNDWTIWVTEHGKRDTVTGMPGQFKVYVRNTVKNSGFSANWKACWEHAYLAYIDIQQIMLDELHFWNKTDQWMQRRNGRI